jgi:hypothetical protein
LVIIHRGILTKKAREILADFADKYKNPPEDIPVGLIAIHI